MNPYTQALSFFAYSSLMVGLLVQAKRRDAVGRRFLIFNVFVVAWIEDALFFTSQKLKYQNVDIQMNLPENLPKVKGDKGQLEEIFLNLFMNALHAMPKGGTLTISTSVIPMSAKGRIRPTPFGGKTGIQAPRSPIKTHAVWPQCCSAAFGDDNLLEVVVSDTGIGMTEDELKSIFTHFYTTKNKEEGRRTDGGRASPPAGTGLGLYIVKTLVEQNLGKISVGSKLGKGTCFSLVLKVINDIL